MKYCWKIKGNIKVPRQLFSFFLPPLPLYFTFTPSLPFIYLIKMMKPSFLFAWIATLQLALAASVTITSPQPNDVLTAGKTLDIKW